MTSWTPKRDERRPEQIRALKAKIERREYEVPAERVADAVIRWYRRMDPISRR